MSAERFFVDSNLWLYTFMRDDEEKKTVAAELIGDPATVLSTQVVNELRQSHQKSRLQRG